MGRGYCGTNDTTGEEMGYSVEGVCHHPECTEKIDHGLSHVCGGMHEGAEHGCGYYFCERHLWYHYLDDDTPCEVVNCQLCESCLKKHPEKEEEGDE